MSENTISSVPGYFPQSYTFTSKPGTAERAKEQLVYTLKEIAQEQAETAKFLEKAGAARAELQALSEKIIKNSHDSLGDLLGSTLGVYGAIVNFRNLEANAYGLADAYGASNSVPQLNAMLDTWRARLSVEGLSEAQIRDTNKRILMAEEALFHKSNPRTGDQTTFLAIRIADWEKQAGDLRHVLEQDGWTPENRKPMEAQIRAIETKIQDAKAFFNVRHDLDTLSSNMFG